MPWLEKRRQAATMQTCGQRRFGDHVLERCPHHPGQVRSWLGPILQPQPWPDIPDGTLMATDITIITSTPSTADSVPCWECSRQVAPYQASRTMNGWQAIICLHCEGWVSSVLGPIPTTITD